MQQKNRLILILMNYFHLLLNTSLQPEAVTQQHHRVDKCAQAQSDQVTSAGSDPTGSVPDPEHAQSPK